MGDINKKIDKLISKRAWNKILKGLGDAEPETLRKIVMACGQFGGSDCIDILSVILNDEKADDDLHKLTIQALGNVGNDRCITILRYFRDHCDPSKADLIETVDAAVRVIKVRVAEEEKKKRLD